MKQKKERKISKKKNFRTFPENEAHEFPNKLKGSLMCSQWMKEIPTQRQILSSETEKILQVLRKENRAQKKVRHQSGFGLLSSNAGS